MTEEMSNHNLKPASETLYLLGSIDAKVGGLQKDVAEVKSTLHTEVAALKADVGGLRSDVDVLKASQRPAPQWFTVVSGLAGIGALIAFVVQFFGQRVA